MNRHMDIGWASQIESSRPTGRIANTGGDCGRAKPGAIDFHRVAGATSKVAWWVTMKVFRADRSGAETAKGAEQSTFIGGLIQRQRLHEGS